MRYHLGQIWFSRCQSFVEFCYHINDLVKKGISQTLIDIFRKRLELCIRCSLTKIRIPMKPRYFHANIMLSFQFPHKAELKLVILSKVKSTYLHAIYLLNTKDCLLTNIANMK